MLLIGAIALGGCNNVREVEAEPEGEASVGVELPPIEHDLGPAGYRDLLQGTLELLATYWDDQLADLGGKPKPPKQLISYWNRRQDEGCGGQPAGPWNAQYCSRSETISWDGNWLFGDLYRKAGDAAVAFLLAHEYGHLVQDQLGLENEFPLTIEAELNADCLAGAWFGAVDADVARLNRVDFDALYAAVQDVADPRGVPWEDPSAHGTRSERQDALLLGGERGPEACLRKLGPGFSRLDA